MSDTLTAPEMADLLRSFTARQGTRWWAREHGIHPAMVSGVQCGTMQCTETIARALGYERVVVYRRVA